ncbi:MAG: SpoIIE family protein phosphatase [Acidobacteriaceae bacterium]
MRTSGWRRRSAILLAVPALLAASAIAPRTALAQLDATQWESGSVDLNRGWREHDGDNPAWAQANFDDSGWTAVDLDDLGAAQPGWRWYRLRVQLAAGQPHLHLLLAGGDGTYELYVNGQKQPGAVIRSIFGVTRPTEQVYSLEGEGTDLVLAVRTTAHPVYTGWHLPLFLTAAVGTPGAIDNEAQALESQRLYAALPSIAINLLLILAGIGAFALYRSQRKHAEYLWLGLYLFLLGTSNLLLNSSTSGVISLAWDSLLADPLVYAITIMQIEFTFSFAGQRVSRVWRAYEWALLTPLILTALANMGKFSINTYMLIESAVILPAALLLPVMLLMWYRRGNREAGWLILPSLLPAATVALFNLGSVSIFSGWGRLDFLADPIPVGPIALQLSDVGDFLFVLAIAVVMFFRFTRVSREQARAAAELDAARIIQERLVPAQLPPVAGYSIEAAYYPAEEVGGDFYQVLKESVESTLVVVGDVSGKGLKAAMTGTLALGALRALATGDLDPAALLMRLNRQLTGTNNEGFVTCLCARIGREGEVTLANAGHLAPYHNGEEVTLQSGLPLGILAETLYEDRVFRLRPGDRLTLMSDGVVEAQNGRGDLFGFERTQALSRETAEAIAGAARRFGQADDITVMTVTRIGDAETRTQLNEAEAGAPA